MELWIRSQDKFDLVPINNPISILKDEWFEGLEKQYQKYNLTYNGKKLGVYNSLEKVLEVLDEIQDKLLLPNIHFNGTYEQGMTNLKLIELERQRIVYEMPKE